ncbi:tripartite tricarboxylate transporter substrate binding protein [Ramlibacter sp. PS3R-8]|uniref:Bug family tripartite tricarboxylate transporter substrate binding protein n=1 Tax=Ramlibacter sp. PS3R-8 TaxID=3133437 RepID=UPI0030AC337C
MESKIKAAGVLRRTACAAFVVAGLACGAGAFAQDFPTKGPVRLIVGFAPGGGTDAIARALNTRMGEVLKQTVIVENRAGAGGTLAADHVAKAAPDGYTVLFTLNNHSINQALYPKLPYDTERDFRGVTLIGSLPQAFAAHPQAKANTIQEFLQLGGKADPKQRVYANGGTGSPGHFAAAYLELISGTEFTHVPYKGAGPAITDVIGGQVPYILSTLTGLLPHIKSGKLKAIALTSAERSPLLPNVPTIAESGFPGYDMDSWMGIFVPRATPPHIVKALNDAMLEALKQPAVRERVESQAGRLQPGTGEELDKIVAEDIKRYTKVVKERGVKAE